MFIAHHGNNSPHRGSPRSKAHLQTEYIEIQSWLCTACGNCINECPQKVIGMVKFLKHRHSHIDQAAECIGCKKCVKACPNGAIIDLKPKAKPAGKKGGDHHSSSTSIYPPLTNIL